MAIKRALQAALAVFVLIAGTSVAPGVLAAKIVGTDGADEFAGTNNGDRIDAGGGDDTVFARDGNDKVFGDAGNDLLFLGAGSDKANGGDGDDTVVDDDGGADAIQGGTGNDLIISADGGKDKIDCGPGNDTALIDNTDVTTNCEHKFHSDSRKRSFIFGSNGDDGILGDDRTGNNTKRSDDTIFGKRGNDRISGLEGKDAIYMGRGADQATGGDDDDVIVDDDGQGGDTITTGPGHDIVYAADGAPTTIDCGDDRDDTAFVDREDSTINCEHIFAA